MARKESWLLLIEFLLSVLLILYLVGRDFGLPVALFWPISLSLVLVTLLIVQSGQRHYQLASMALLCVAISLIPIAAEPEPFKVGVDGAFEAQFASLIVQEGRWDPTRGSGFAENYYGHNPVLHFVLSFASLASGIDTYALLKYFFFIFIRLAMVLFVFVVVSTLLEYAFKENSPKEITYLALFIFLGSSGMAFLSVTRRSMASLLLLLCIWAILKARGEQKTLWNILFMIFSLMVIVANHSISFYLLFFLGGALLFSLGFRLIDPTMVIFKGIAYKVIYVAVMLLLWEVFLAEEFVGEDLTYLAQIANTAIGGEGRGSLLGSASASGISIYRLYESIVIYSAQLLFLLLGALGLLWYLKRSFTSRKQMRTAPYFLLYLAAFGFLMYLVSALFMKTGHDTAVTIILWFFCLPISIFAAYFLIGMRRKIDRQVYMPVLCCIIVFLFAGSLLMGVNTPKITNRAPLEDIVAEVDSRAITEELYHAGKWLKQNGRADAKALGDFTVFDMFSGFFLIDVTSDHYYLSQLYLGNESDINELVANDNVEFGSYRHTPHDGPIDYIVMNQAFSKYPSIGFGAPFKIDTADLDNNSMLDRTYANDEIEIYQVKRN